MVLTQDDTTVIAHFVAMTVGHMQAATSAAAEPPPATTLTELHVLKNNIFARSAFSGVGWKDFAFQFKAATRNSSDVAYEMLTWIEQDIGGRRDKLHRIVRREIFATTRRRIQHRHNGPKGRAPSNDVQLRLQRGRGLEKADK